MTKTYDVIVAGAGPAGLLAAQAAGAAGFSVALLERKPDICRLERMCGQTLVSANDYYFDDLVHFAPQTGRIGFLRSGLSFPYDGPVKNLYGWHIYSPGGARLPFGLPEQTRRAGQWGPVGFACDKELLLQSLLAEARKAGIDVYTGAEAAGVEELGNSVRVSAGGSSFEGSFLIAADGTNSRIARAAGFDRERHFYCYLLAMGWQMRGVKVPEPDILLSGITYRTAAPGFMFIFPRPYEGEHMVVFLTLEPTASLDDVARSFMHDSPFFSPWFSHAEPVRRLASAQQILSPVADPCRGRIVLAGDAGSCQELENTGAMLSGWRAGLAAAAALKEERCGIAPRAMTEYVQWWQSTYIEKCPHDVYLMNFALPYVLDTEEDLNGLFSLIREPLAPCWNPYAAISLIGGLMQQLGPDIQAQRPELLVKLTRMSLPMTEVLSRATAACRPVRDIHEDQTLEE